MAIEQPIGTDTLNSPSHSLQHRIIAADASAPVQSIAVDANGMVSIPRGQIKFPATAVPSADPNTIDDYEEGTYTVTLTCGTSGTITISTLADIYSYTKTARVVFCSGSLLVSSVSSPVGDLQLLLPFTCLTGIESSDRFVGPVSYDGISAISTPGALVARGYEGLSCVSIRELTTTGFLNDVANKIKANTYLEISFSFLAE